MSFALDKIIRRVINCTPSTTALAGKGEQYETQRNTRIYTYLHRCQKQNHRRRLGAENWPTSRTLCSVAQRFGGQRLGKIDRKERNLLLQPHCIRRQNSQEVKLKKISPLALQKELA